jgi:hypothetical protein
VAQVSPDDGISVAKVISCFHLMNRYALQLQPLMKKLKAALAPMQSTGVLTLFKDLINWDLDPFFNYPKVYNVSTEDFIPKWSPDFEFHGSGSRIRSPLLSDSQLKKEGVNAIDAVIAQNPLRYLDISAERGEHK